MMTTDYDMYIMTKLPRIRSFISIKSYLHKNIGRTDEQTESNIPCLHWPMTRFYFNIFRASASADSSGSYIVRVWGVRASTCPISDVVTVFHNSAVTTRI